MKYYSAIKRNGLSIHITVGMHLKGIMLSERKLISKEWHTRWFHLHNLFEMTLRDGRQTRGWQGLEAVREGKWSDEWLERNGTREMMTVQFCILTAVVVTWISSLIKWHGHIHTHCTNVTFLVLILYYSDRCTHWGKLGEYIEPLWTILKTFYESIIISKLKV